MDGLIGKKIGMTQVFNEDGTCIPVTVIQLGPCYVLQKKSKDTDGYNAIKIGYDEVKENKVNKPKKGVYKKLNITPLRIEREFQFSEDKYKVLKPGDKITISDVFKENEYVDITGTTKGKGFQGVVKRHGFGGGAMAHGSKFHRELGSIGQHTFPARVFPGKRFPGRMGGNTVTMQNLLIVKIDNNNSLLLVKGAVPGKKGSYVLVKKAVKKIKTKD